MKETKLIEKETHISEAKQNEVEKLRRLFSEYDTIALVDLTALPSPQLQIIRSKLKKDDVIVRVTKKRLIKKALDDFKGKEGIGEFVPLLDNVMPALIFSKLNAFKLSSFLRRNKSKVAAKPGQVSPKDLVVNAGPTPFAPGPMIGELGSLGIKSAVEQGKIVIKKDTVVVKHGEIIKAKVADLLAKLGIKPMEIGLNLAAAYEGGIVVDKEVLDIDDRVYIDEVGKIALDAFKLTISIGYVTKDNIKLLLAKANREAEAIGGLVPEQLSLENLKEENLKEEKLQENKEGERMVEIVDEPVLGETIHKEKKMVPSARELAEKKKQKEDQLPDLYELAKRNKKAVKVPSAYELAEKKKGREEK